MKQITDPARYEAWYQTPRGHWIGSREFVLLRNLLRPDAGASLLDAGCGTGYFSRCFVCSGLSVTGEVLKAPVPGIRLDWADGAGT